MAGNKQVNSDLEILGKVIVSRVLNNTGTVVTYNADSKEISQRTNAEIIADLGLITATNIASAYYTKLQLQTSGQAQVNWGNITEKPTTFPATAHNHDDRYYTETESDTKFIPYTGAYQDLNMGVHGGTFNSIKVGHQVAQYIGLSAPQPIAVLNGGQAQGMLMRSILLADSYYNSVNVPNVGLFSTGPLVIQKWATTTIDGDNLIIRKPDFAGGGWARVLMQFQAHDGVPYYSIGAVGAGNTYDRGYIDTPTGGVIEWFSNRTVKINTLAGSGTRMVTADAEGILGTTNFIKVGVANMLLTTATKDWTSYYSDGGDRVVTNTERGARIVATSGNAYWSLPKLETIDAEEYILSFEYKSTTPFGIYFYDPYHINYGGLNTGGVWEKFIFKYTKSGTGGTSVLFGFHQFNGEIEFRNLKLERGNIVTDWIPAPEDMVTDWNDINPLSFARLKNKPTSFPAAAHTHDDRYYTETESLNLFVGLNGVQTIEDTKTFTSSPIVPNGTLDSHAVNKGQLNTKSDVGHTHSLLLDDVTHTTLDLDTLIQSKGMTFKSQFNPGGNNMFPTIDSDNAVLTLSTWTSGALGHQLGFSANGNIYHRYGRGAWQNWNTIATQTWVSNQNYLTASNLNGYATQTYVNDSIAALVDSSPATLDTLNELAAALGDDPNFATTMTNLIGTKENAFVKNTAFNKNFGTAAGEVAEGNHTHAYSSLSGLPDLTQFVDKTTEQEILGLKRISRGIDVNTGWGNTKVKEDYSFILETEPGSAPNLSRGVSIGFNLLSGTYGVQAGIYFKGNTGNGTHMAFATTDLFSDGPKIAMSINHSGIVDFERELPTFQGTALATQTWVANNYYTKTQLQTSGQASVNWGNITNVPATFTPGSHTHAINDVTGLQSALEGKVDDSQVLTNVPAGAVFTDTIYNEGNGLELNGTTFSIKQDVLEDIVLGVQAHGWGNHASVGYLTSSSLNGYATQNYVVDNFAYRNGTNASGTWARDSQGILVNGSVDGKTFIGTSPSTLLAANNGSVAGVINSTYESPVTGQWYHSLKMLHANQIDPHYTEIAVMMSGTPGMYYKQFSAGNTLGWIQLLDVREAQTVTGIKTFRTTGNDAVNNIPLQAYSDNASFPAISFHKSGAYAGSIALAITQYQFRNQSGTGLLNAKANAFLSEAGFVHEQYADPDALLTSDGGVTYTGLDIINDGGELRIQPLETTSIGNAIDCSIFKHKLVYIRVIDGNKIVLNDPQQGQRFILFNVGDYGSEVEINSSSVGKLEAFTKISLYITDAGEYIFYDKGEISVGGF